MPSAKFDRPHAAAVRMATNSPTTFADLVQRTGWPDVKAALLWLYPDAREDLVAYRRVFSDLCRMRPSASTMRICIMTPELDSEEHTAVEVFARNGALNRDQDDFKQLGEARDSPYALRETEYAIELESWSHWLGMRVDDETLRAHPVSQIVAHCLWEMTSYAFAEADVVAFRKELDRRVAEVDAWTE